MFEHVHLVSHADTQRTSRGTLADDNADDGHLQYGHLHEVPCNGFALPTLFSFYARISTHGVDEGNHRLAELLGEFHQSECFSVSLGIGHAKVAELTLFGILAFLVANDHHRLAANGGKAAHDGFIIAHIPVAVELDEIVADQEIGRAHV